MSPPNIGLNSLKGWMYNFITYLFEFKRLKEILSLGEPSCTFGFSFARLVLKLPVCIVNFFLARTELTRVQQNAFVLHSWSYKLTSFLSWLMINSFLLLQDSTVFSIVTGLLWLFVLLQELMIFFSR